MPFKPEKRTATDGAVSYSVRVDLPRDPVTGKRRQARLSASTVKELRRQHTALLHSMQTDAYIEPTKATVGQYMARWLEAYARHNVRQTTYRSYEQMIRLHIAPGLG